MTPRTSSPTTTVLSQGATTAWVSGTGAVQVQLPAQLIRSNMQNRTRLVQPGTGNASITNIFNAPTQTGNQTISVSTTSTGQPTFVATVHTPRHQPGATLVYANAQQQFINTPQRIGVTTTNTRQVRPVQRLPTTGIRLNQAALSIRGSLSNNVPILAPTSVMSTTVQARGTVASTSISNTIPARIIQVQSQQGTTNVTANRKIISNVMTVPIIVNNSLGHQVKSQIQTPIAITHSKIDTTTTSAAAGSQPASSSSTIYASSSQGQIITVSQQQIINSTLHQSHLHQQNQPAGAMVRKTLNVTAAGGTVDGRSAANTTILPISKIIQQQNEQQSLATLGLTTSSYQPTSVYIHTRTPTAGTVTSTASSSAQVVHCSTSAAATHFAGGTVYYDHPVSSNSSPVTVTSSSNDKSSTAPNCK